jgi:hypothetical protein
VKDGELMKFLDRHLRRKKKYYAMIKYLQSKNVNETLKHSVDKHNLKYLSYDKNKIKKMAPAMRNERAFTGLGGQEFDIRTHVMTEKVDKKKLTAYINKKIDQYGVSRTICPLLVVLDDFAGHPLLERKETPLARMMTKCRHYSCTFIIAAQTVKYVIKNIKRQATDMVIWSGVSQEDFFNLFKEIAFSYDVKQLWEEYRKLPTQTSHLILNIKAQQYRFVPVEVK